MPYSRNLYENMPLYARLFDARTGEILRHLCEAIQVEFDVIHRLIEEYEYFLFLPSTLNDGFLDFLQQYVGLGYEGGDRWIGVAIKPDWPTWRKKAAIAAAWQYWRSKGTEWGVRKAYEIWCEWDEAFSEERLELRMPFGETNTATPPQWWGWGTRYDAHLTQLYAERQHLGGAYKPGFEYQPPGILLEYPRWRWDYAEPWSPRILDAFAPTQKINSQHGMGPREVWEHFRPDLDDLDFFEWNEIFDRVRELHAECWPLPYLPRIWAWLERPPVEFEIDAADLAPEFLPQVSVRWSVGGMNWGDWWRFPIASETVENRVVEEEVSAFRPGWRWGEGAMPGTGGEARPDPTDPADLIERECQSWYGATWGDPQDLRAVFRQIGSWVPVTRGGSRLGWGELWNSLPWYHPGATEWRWIVATHRFGPFRAIAGEPWFAAPEVAETTTTVRPVPGGFNAIAPTWGKLGGGDAGDPGGGTEPPPPSGGDSYSPPDPSYRRVEIFRPAPGNWPATARWGAEPPTGGTEPADSELPPESRPRPPAPAELWGEFPWGGSGGYVVEIAPPESARAAPRPGATWGGIPKLHRAEFETVVRTVAVEIPGERRDWGEPWGGAAWPHPDRVAGVTVSATAAKPKPKPPAAPSPWPASFPDEIRVEISVENLPGGFESGAAAWGGGTSFPDPEWVESPVEREVPGNFGECAAWGDGSPWGDAPPRPAETRSPASAGTFRWGDGRADWLYWQVSGATSAVSRSPGNARDRFAWGTPWTIAPDETGVAPDATPAVTVEPDNYGSSLRWGSSPWNSGREWWRNRRVVNPAREGSGLPDAPRRRSQAWAYPDSAVEIFDSGRRGNWGAGAGWATPSGAPATPERAGNPSAPLPYYRRPGRVVVGSEWLLPESRDSEGRLTAAARAASEAPTVGFAGGASGWGSGSPWYRDWDARARAREDRVAVPVPPIAAMPWASSGVPAPEPAPEFRRVAHATPGTRWGSFVTPVEPVAGVPVPPAEPPQRRPAEPGAWGALAAAPGKTVAVSPGTAGVARAQAWTLRDGRSPWLAWAFGSEGTVRVEEPDNRRTCAGWGVPWTAISGEGSAAEPTPGRVSPDNWGSAQRWGGAWGGEWFRPRRTARPRNPLATAGLSVRASRPWYRNLEVRSVSDSGERHSWGSGNAWGRRRSRGSADILQPPSARARTDVSHPWYRPPGEVSAGFVWVRGGVGESETSGTAVPGSSRDAPPPAASFSLPARAWGAGASWYWDSPGGEIVEESVQIRRGLAFPAIAWQKNLTVETDYDPANYPPIWREFVTAGEEWYADIHRVERRTVETPAGEDWEIGGTDGAVIVGRQVEEVRTGDDSGATDLVAADIPAGRVTVREGFGGAIPGFEWGNQYAPVGDGEFPFQVSQPFQVCCDLSADPPDSWMLADPPSISLVGDLPNLVADWSLFGTAGEKIRWHRNCWQAGIREEKTEVVPGRTEYALPERSHVAEYADYPWPVVGLWGVFVGAEGRLATVRTPVVAEVRFPNLFGFWSEPELDGRWEDDVPPPAGSPTALYPDLRAACEARNWTLVAEIDGRLKPVSPVTHFWSADGGGDRSVRYSESRPTLNLEFVFEPDIDNPNRDWGPSKIRGTALMFRGEMFDYRSYDWYGRLTSHDAQAVGVRYAVRTRSRGASAP